MNKLTERKTKQVEIGIKKNNRFFENILYKRKINKETNKPKSKTIKACTDKVEIKTNKNLNQNTKKSLYSKSKNNRVMVDNNKSINYFKIISDYIEKEDNTKKLIHKKFSKDRKLHPNKSINNNQNKRINRDVSNKKEKNYSININDFDMNLLDSGNELDTSNITEKKNLQIAEFPELSVNPFSTKHIHKNLRLNNKSKKKILKLKNKSIGKDKKLKFNKTKNENKIIMSDDDVLKLKDSNDSSEISDSTEELKFNSEISEKFKEQKYKKLLLLAKKGDNEKFSNIIKQIKSLQKQTYININYQDENGYTALHYACEEGNLKIVETLLNANCNPNIKNNLNQTPIHLSTERGYFDITKKLIESGAKLNIEDSENNYPIHFICKNNYVELLKYILTKSPQINCKNKYGKTPRDLTTNSEIKNILDNYIKKIEDKLNNKNRAEIRIIKSSKNNNINKNNNITKNLKNNINIIISKVLNNSPIYQRKYKLNTINEIPDSNNKTKLYISNKILNTSSKIRYNTDNSITNLSNTINGNLNNKKINKEEKNQILYFKNTNNINNKNININFFSIETKKKFNLYIKDTMKENLDGKNRKISNNILSFGENDFININNLMNKKKGLTHRNDPKMESLDICNIYGKNFFIFNENEENLIKESKHKKNIISNNIDSIPNNKIRKLKLTKDIIKNNLNKKKEKIYLNHKKIYKIIS